MNRKNWSTFSSLDAIHFKNPNNFNADSFSWQNSFHVLFMVLLFFNQELMFSFLTTFCDSAFLSAALLKHEL